MYLKSLELYGFKSFPDRTKLLFEKGTTVIVGPNGSGKSNISDAMKWVLGEISTKSIRGTKMEDIIFSGTEARKPMGFAEVSVTFDNTSPENRLDCPYDEVTVTRRYYRVGESEYFINRRAVRLRDIYELFMNTGIGRDGYSIIGQGKIAEIISRKSEERRGIFEDASGIAKFRFKKNEAERKLSQTLDNLTRVNDIFTEIESQILPLEKEAGKAKRAIELMDRKKEADIRLWLFESERLTKAIEHTTAELERARFDLQNITEAVNSIQAQNDSLIENSKSNKVLTQGLLEQIRRRTNDNYKIENDFRLTERNIQHIREMISAAVASIEGYKRMIEAEIVAIEDKKKYISDAGERLRASEEEHVSGTKAYDELCMKAETLREAADRAFADIRTLEAEISEIRTQIAVLENASKSDSDTNDSASEEIAKYESANELLLSQVQSKQKLLDTYNKNIATLDERLERLHTELSELSEKRESDASALASLVFSRDSKQQRVDTYKALEEQFDGYIGSVKYVMRAYSEGKILTRSGALCGTIYGPLSKVISVEDKYLTAIETALGANLQHIVVEDEATAKDAMFALKKAEKGRATFFPITSMKGQSPSKEVLECQTMRGFVSVADSLVSCEDKFYNIISSLLSRTVVFEDIDSANEAAKKLGFRIRIVTLDGQQINVGGSFTGGSVNRNSGVLTRAAEIKHLEDELEELEKDIAVARAGIDALDTAIDELHTDVDESENNKHLMEAMVGTILPEYEKLKAQIDANNTLIEKMRSDLDSVELRRAEYKGMIDDLTHELDEYETRMSELKAFRESKVVEANDTEDEADLLNKKLTELFIRISGVRKDIETQTMLLDSSSLRIADIERSISEAQEKILVHEQSIRECEADLVENRRLAAEGDEILEQLKAELSDVEDEGAEFEKRMLSINSRMKELIENKEIAVRETTILENKLQNLVTDHDKIAPTLMDDYGMTRADALRAGYTPVSDDEEKAELFKIQTECRNKLRAIGHVDLNAVEKYNEIKERYDVMSVQLADLREAESKIRSEIRTLEGQMKNTFLDAFNKINENFNRVFSELFGGGHAEIILTDPDDVLSSGIEIKAAPPGKIIKNLMQLSGGEQSFIAIALYFATLQVNPTPFCIFDEIEAALDEANVARFANYIKRYSDNTQFIVISHRRGTMEAAERLYGVTMPERGISKVLNLVISELAGKGDNELDGLFR